MTHDSSHGSSSKLPLMGIILVVAAYAAAGSAGWPQHGTELIVAAASHHHDHQGHDAHDEHHEHDHHVTPDDHHQGEAGHAADAKAHEAAHDEHGEHDAHDEHKQHADAGHGSQAVVPPPLWTVTPFVLLLLAIAVFPLLRATEHWWEHNLHRFYVAALLGLVTLAYYAFVHQSAVEAHWPAHAVVEPASSGIQWQMTWTVFANAMLSEYIPFIVLLFSLYTISGGIRISGDLRAHPLTNVVFITVGGLLASFVGTTGAAMLLIRPLLSTNSERKHVQHTVIFFIFVVCNCGGCLLPIGDPPLFLGYLRGVPFLWTMKLVIPWFFVNLALLVIYWVWDHYICYPKETLSDVSHDETEVSRLRIEGLGINGPLLLGVILCVALLDPSKPVPGTDWHAWMYLREVMQLGLVGVSLWLGSNALREANRFDYHAIVEVAALFCGIFVCMQPALQILNSAGPSLGIDTPMEFFWITGILSSFLDNAPTYVVFFETAKTISVGDPTAVAGVRETFLVAISLGAVFMGAMSYIGNGPNFMVKAIAEASGIRMPSFFGYMIYSVCVLLPVLAVATWIMFAAS